MTNTITDTIVLRGKQITVSISATLSLTIVAASGETWRSSSETLPSLTLTDGRQLALHIAQTQRARSYTDGDYQGKTLILSDFPNTDAIVELTVAISATQEELLVQVEQTGGNDVVQEINHLYRIEKPTSAGGYMLIPHGSGYVIRADCPDELPGQFMAGGLVGARWTLPIFAMVGEHSTMSVLVDTWWDCDVEASHRPGEQSVLDFHWRGSLGKLDYARRALIQISPGTDHVAIAKRYRAHAAKQGLIRTLEEKAEQTPVIRRYVENVLVRWTAWKPEEVSNVVASVQRMKKEIGAGINFFFPKWPSAGYAPDRPGDGGWQAYHHENPVPGGWSSLAILARRIRELNCPIQGFMNQRKQLPEAPAYSETFYTRDAENNRHEYWASTRTFEKRVLGAIDHAASKGLDFDVMYYDALSAYDTFPEDYTPGRRTTRREAYENQNALLDQSRRRGIMPGAEVARFWCIPHCDYFFFTDWSRDRLTNTTSQGAPKPVGEPIPFFQLVFHDCYVSGFSAGGYGLYARGYDWWPDRTPRLYELLFTSAPAHNWLPNGEMPIQDWDSPYARNRWRWLKRWSNYYSKVAMSEMISHQFQSGDDKWQRIEFANGVTAEFDFSNNRCRLTNVEGFTGEWEEPCGDLVAPPT